MNMLIALSFCVISLQIVYGTVTMKPDTVSSNINVNLAPDTRIITDSGFENNGVYNNQWRINFRYSGQSMTDWYVIN